MLDALGQLTRTPSADTVVQTLAKRAPTWLIQFPSLVRPEQREDLQRARFWERRRERMVREICEALESLSSETPILLVLKISTGLTLPHWISYPRWRGVVNKPN